MSEIYSSFIWYKFSPKIQIGRFSAQKGYSYVFERIKQILMYNNELKWEKNEECWKSRVTYLSNVAI